MTGLPAFARDPERATEDDLAPYRSMTPEERGQELDRLSRSAPLLLEFHPNPDQVLRGRDPLPASTRAWMERYGLHPGPDR